MQKWSSIYSKLWIIDRTPKRFLDILRAIKRSKALHRVRSKVRIKRMKIGRPTVTLDVLKKDLSRLGLSHGTKVMVHSSLSGLGFVEGGAAVVIQALLEIIGQEGLIVMPCPPVSGSSLASVRSKTIFDPETTPCTTGKICEEFRKLPGVLRSLHPVQSVAALGPEAEWLTKDHHLDSTPFGPSSPYQRLLELDASILGMGLDVRWITLYHRFEDMCEQYPIRVYCEESFKIPVLQKDGSHILVSTSYHDPAVSAVRENNDPETFAILDEALNRYSAIVRATIGEGRGYIVKARMVIQTLERMLYNDAQTIYNLNILRKRKPEAFVIKENALSGKQTV